MRSKGIILVQPSEKRKLCKTLDYVHGIILSLVTRKDLCMGSCIEYTINEQKQPAKFEDIELVALPKIANMEDLLLIHRSLELCECCMPVGSSTPGIFEHMMYLYDKKVRNERQEALLKKVFLCKLLSLLGFYPTDKKFNDAFFNAMVHENFENFLQIQLIADEQKINEWLWSCIGVHMHDHRLKTLSLDRLVEVL